MTTSLFNRIKPDQIADRLDGEYYARELLENEAKLNHFNQVTLENCVTNVRNAISDLTSNGSFEFLRGIQFNDINGIPYIRTQNLMEGYIDSSDVIYVDLKCKDMVAKSICETGDLIVCRKGKVGAASAVSADMNGAAISENVTRFRLQESYDGDFLAAFLISNHGRMRFLREATGVIQKWINNEKLRQISVIRIDSSAEKYIGDKVRQAEQLRTWAKRSEKRALDLFNKQVDWSIEVLKVGKINKVLVSELNGRLDLKYNSPARLALLRHIKNKQITTTELVRLVDISAMIGWKGLTTEYYTNFGPWLLRGVEFRDGVIEFEKLVSVDRDKYLEQPQIHLKEGDIAFSKDGTIGKAIVIPKLANDMAAGSTIARLRLKKVNEINPYYLELVLNHDFVQVQVESFATGIAQPHITQEWIAQLIIPRVKYEQVIGEYLSIHHLANNNSKILIQAAKTLVESLIEGQLTEHQLIQAQQALEDGDNSLDQAILSKLSAEGYAIEGATPLFSDVDELYGLLEEAAQAEAEE